MTNISMPCENYKIVKNDKYQYKYYLIRCLGSSVFSVTIYCHCILYEHTSVVNENKSIIIMADLGSAWYD